MCCFLIVWERLINDHDVTNFLNDLYGFVLLSCPRGCSSPSYVFGFLSFAFFLDFFEILDTTFFEKSERKHQKKIDSRLKAQLRLI